jgi:hypothetical protein
VLPLHQSPRLLGGGASTRLPHSKDFWAAFQDGVIEGRMTGKGGVGNGGCRETGPFPCGASERESFGWRIGPLRNRDVLAVVTPTPIAAPDASAVAQMVRTSGPYEQRLLWWTQRYRLGFENSRKGNVTGTW